MATATETREPVEELSSVFERAGISTDLSGYTDEQLQRAAELQGSELGERKLRERIMGNGESKPPRKVKRQTLGSMGKVSMREATVEVLKRAKGPLHTSEIAKRVLANPMVETKGKTPEASIGARLAVGAKRGEFVRTAPGTFTLPGKAAAGGKGKAK